MKETINKINLQISEKRDRLKEKAERYFDCIVVPMSATTPTHSLSKKGSVPPVSYILYGIAGVSAICTFATDSKILFASIAAINSKILFAGIAAISAFGGYIFSQNNHNDKNTAISYNTDSLSSVKTDMISKVLESVKKTTKEWEDFMELKQKEIQTLIDTAPLEANKKDELLSKIFVFDVIDISISEFSGMINTASSLLEIQQRIKEYKIKLLNAIDDAANKQIKKYKSLYI